MSILHRISHLDAHKRLLISLGIAGLATLGLCRFVDPATLVIAVWLIYTVASLSFIWITILTAHPRNLSALFKAQDMSRTLSFLFVILSAFASLIAIFLLYKEGIGVNKSLHAALSALVVLSSWLLVHTVFTLRYAHLYYEKQPQTNGNEDHKYAGGLDFPDDNAPDYLDFAYFSFIIGMTSQVSDVAIQSKRMRRLALISVDSWNISVLLQYFNYCFYYQHIILYFATLKKSLPKTLPLVHGYRIYRLTDQLHESINARTLRCYHHWSWASR